MKLQMIVLFLPLLLLTTSCGLFKDGFNTSTTRQSLTGITQIKLEGYGVVELTQSDNEQLEIKTKKEVYEHIHVKTEGNHLTIHVDEGKIPKPHPEIEFRIRVKSIESLNSAGGFTITSTITKTDQLHADFSGSTTAEVKINATELDLGLTGVSNVTLSGRTSKQSIRAEGATNYAAENLQSTYCSINASGSVTASVNCSQEIDGTLSGSSVLYYSGNPKVSVQTSGASTIKALR